MIQRIEALNYRALRYIGQTLAPFQVLIGPNASGKSTFLDVLALVADVLNEKNVVDALRLRAPDLHDLTWQHQSDWFELALEVAIPEGLRPPDYGYVRYELRIELDEASGEVGISAENLWFLKQPTSEAPHQASLPEMPKSLIHQRTPNGWRSIIKKTSKGDYFKSETTDWNNQFSFGRRRSALANALEDETRFRVTTWLKTMLSQGVQRIMLNSEAMRRPVPPQTAQRFLPDGANLPIVAQALREQHPQRFADWVAHVQTALPDIADIRTVQRPEDRHSYLLIAYHNGLEAPSWTVSDGTLRLLALTLLAYAPQPEAVILIEEPENGIHPQAIETVMQSLGSVYDAQVLVATHSPVVLSMMRAEQMLCFARTEAGETAIVRGDQHPRLKDWLGNSAELADLFASGVLS